MGALSRCLRELCLSVYQHESVDPSGDLPGPPTPGGVQPILAVAAERRVDGVHDDRQIRSAACEGQGDPSSMKALRHHMNPVIAILADQAR